ncbi:MAG: hypothetical protein WCT23_06490 [Candidatus Neomarinimicrobiota bacterium]
MKKLMIGLMVALMLILSSCDFGELTGGWNTNDDDDNVTLAELIEAELLAETDVEVAIEEEIEIEIPESFAKTAPRLGGNGRGGNGNGGNGRGRNSRRVRMWVRQSIDSVDVQKAIEYTADDTALVTLSKTIMGSLIINQTDTAIVDTPEVWEKDYTYVTTSYMQFVQVECVDHCRRDTSDSDSIQYRWKITAKSIATGETAGILNTIESVTLEADDDSLALVYDDPEMLYPVERGSSRRGHYRGRPGRNETEVYVLIDGGDDVNVLGSTGRYFKLLDDGEDLDLTADDNIYSGSVLKGWGQSRLRVRMIATAAFLEKEAPVEMNTWFLPVK